MVKKNKVYTIMSECYKYLSSDDDDDDDNGKDKNTSCEM